MRVKTNTTDPFYSLRLSRNNNYSYNSSSIVIQTTTQIPTAMSLSLNCCNGWSRCSVVSEFDIHILTSWWSALRLSISVKPQQILWQSFTIDFYLRVVFLLFHAHSICTCLAPLKSLASKWQSNRNLNQHNKRKHSEWGMGMIEIKWLCIRVSYCDGRWVCFRRSHLFSFPFVFYFLFYFSIQSSGVFSVFVVAIAKFQWNLMVRGILDFIRAPTHTHAHKPTQVRRWGVAQVWISCVVDVNVKPGAKSTVKKRHHSETDPLKTTTNTMFG